MKERIKCIEPPVESGISIRKQCKMLGLNRSSLYKKPSIETELNLEIMKQIDKQHLNHPTKGVIQMASYLVLQGYKVNTKRIRRLMRVMTIYPIYPKPNLSKLGRAEYIYPYLLRNKKAERPNQVWAIDISYIPMEKGFMYLTVIIDVYSRYIINWSLSNTIEAETQTKLVSESIEIFGAPQIINSDQGSQYTSQVWVDCLHYYKIQISMDGKGRATDNAFIERFFRTIKQEYIYLNPEKKVIDLYRGMEQYIGYYNYKRPHQGINQRIPVELYKEDNTRISTGQVQIPAGLSSVEKKDFLTMKIYN